MNKIVEIKMNEHELALKNELKYLLNNENYWNVMMFCKDGTMAHNRLTAGLIFPQLQDEISVICPDYTMQDITDKINKLLYFGEVVDNKRDKICASHIVDSDVRNFVQDLGFTESGYNGKVFANNELPNQELNLDVSFDLDIPMEAEETNKELSPLDQLCLDLAPFNQSPKDKNKKDIPVSECSPLIASNTPKQNVSQVQLQQLSSDINPSNQTNLNLDNSLEGALRKFHNEVFQLADTCLEQETFQAETSESIVKSAIEYILNNINYDNYFENRGLPTRSNSVDSFASNSSTAPQPSNLIFSTLGSFRQAESDEPVIKFTAYESQLGFGKSQFSPLKAPLSPIFEDFTPTINFDNSYEYIEEKPDISTIGPVISKSRSLNCRVDIERMNLSAENWRVIHTYLEEADEDDIKAKNKCQKQTSNHTRIVEKSVRFRENTIDNIKRDARHKVQRVPGKRPKRINRCFKCENCMAPDCRKCLYCKDMKKYGGRGTKKQSCVERKKCMKYSEYEFKNKSIKVQDKKEHKSDSDEDMSEDEDKIAQTSIKKYKTKRMLEKEKELEEIKEKRRKVREIKEKFKKQEAALKAGKNPLLSVLSKDELLFGFHL